MNRIALLLMALCVITSGCSSVIIGRGQYREVLRYSSDRATVRNAIGEPVRSATSEGAALESRYDCFKVRGRVVPNEFELSGHMQGIILSLGFFEIFAFPASVVMVPIDSRKEHTLYVYYDRDGKYVIHSSDSWPYSVTAPDEE